jgi:hypothetical protein
LSDAFAPGVIGSIRREASADLFEQVLVAQPAIDAFDRDCRFTVLLYVAVTKL